jgi:PhzF family phenazine biosynthesis protein
MVDAVARKRAFVEVDVFASAPFAGNPLAVVLDGTGLSDEQMQRFANWTNFSETTFLFPPTDPECDYLVRIFTGSMELPFAGHPTLGSCHAWLASGGVPRQQGRIMQQCGIGQVAIERSDGQLSFQAPPLLRSGPLDQTTHAEVVRALGINEADVLAATWIDNGPGWLGVLVTSNDILRSIKPISTTLKIGVAALCDKGANGGAFAYEVRGFFPAEGIVFEDPVTGSLNASLAQWLIADGKVTAPYVALQGTALGRAGHVSIRTDSAGSVWVGGNTTTLVEGSVLL